ncbi:hypothetical protein J3R82DRAFT_6096 [Butyriboletus roseoflavus]|nr:hypothetical protein J3R82DRAFT_6096 [Butyriboletus roseoflavus]
MPPSLLDDASPPMLAYDSSSSSSSPPLRHRLRRNRSPSPHHSYFAPYSRQYSPSSREADIARLLDPAYASPATHSPLIKSPRMAPKEVYVDHSGDLHDPDFRHFPVFGHSHMQSRQSRWEQGYADDDDDDEDDEDCQFEQRRPSFDPQPPRPSSTVTFHPPPVYYPYEEPASYESRYLIEDEDGEHLVDAPLKEKSFHSRPRSPTMRSKGQDEKQSPSTVEGHHVIQADSEWTPTCTQNLRRHWQAIVLSLRFTLFRTKRRLRRRLTG